MKVFFSSVLLLSLFINLTSHSAEKMRIAVLNLKADGVPERTARTVSDMLRAEFVNIGQFVVVERAQMDAILKEQGLQKTGCTDQECAVEIGKIMAARKILVGTVSPLGSGMGVTANDQGAG